MPGPWLTRTLRLAPGRARVGRGPPRIGGNGEGILLPCFKENANVASGNKETFPPVARRGHLGGDTAMADFRFIDLFAGIGGMRLAGEAAGGECVFSSEINAAAARTYSANFGEVPAGDITQIASSDIPEHDAIFAGFPCQSFSKGGKGLGFEDTRGTLFFEVARIARDCQPRLLVLENVKGLVQHDGGRTLGVISATLADLGYSVSWRLMNANRFGLAQSRERILIVARRGPAFAFPEVDGRPIDTPLRAVLDRQGEFEFLDPAAYTLLDPGIVKRSATGLVFSGYRNKNIRLVGVKPGTEHLSRVHKQPNRIYRTDGLHPTLSSQESCGRYFIEHEGRVRKITLAEAFRLQGFPEGFARLGSVGDQHRQIGNSVPISMVAEIACRAVDAPIRRPALRAAA